MVHIQPFSALKPVVEKAHLVAAPPYDVINSNEARLLVKGNPDSFLHITKSEVDLPEDIDIHSAVVYQKAKDNLQSFIEKGVLVREPGQAYYIYQLTMNGRSQTGLVALSSVKDYENNIIKKHEFTRPEKEQDRINHMMAIGAHTGNVFLAYNNVEEIDLLIEDWKHHHSPVYDFTAEDHISHTIWTVDDKIVIDQITQLFAEKVSATYIADGHHRAASAHKVSQQFNHNPHTQYFLTTIFPANELTIMDYNRVVRDLNGMSEADFLSAIEKDFTVTERNLPVAPSAAHEFGMYLDGKWYQLQSRPDTYTNDPIGILDVSILTNNILDKWLNIKDQRTDNRIDFVGGIRGLGELQKRVDSGEMRIAFSLFPVSIQQLFTIADNGLIMPPKSTWFEPKLRDGLLTHVFTH